jgi:integrase/recombinase XerD
MAKVYKRGTTWWVRFQINGHHIRKSAKTTSKAEATIYLHKLIGEHGSMIRGDLPRRAYEQGVEPFFIEASIRPKTKDGYRTSHRALAPFFTGIFFDQIACSGLVHSCRPVNNRVYQIHQFGVTWRSYPASAQW